MRFLEFFAANIRNPHTRRAYARAAEEFLTWCADAGVPSIAAVQPVHVAAWMTERGVQITIAGFLKDRFGDYLYGTAATLTAVALGLSQTPSSRGSRSAFSVPKAAKRSRARSRKNDLSGRLP